MRITLLDVLDRAESGPVCMEKEWDMRVIPGAIAKALKKYELAGTCTPEIPINCDDSIADRYWEAGLEMAVDTGMLCASTERIIKFSREELLDGLREAPDHWHAGVGLDACDLKSRRPEDPHPPITVMGGFGIVIDEDLFIPVTQSHCQNKSVNGTVSGSLAKVYGRELRSGTPYETLGGAHESWLTQEALKRAGRPGMFVVGAATAPLEYGTFGGLGVPGGYSIAQALVPCLLPSELKTNYHVLQKVTHCANFHAAIASAHWTTIGGYAGTPEGCAVAAIASGILQPIVNRGWSITNAILDSRYLGACGREALWANSIACQAVNRNTHLLNVYPILPVSGPLTEMILREVTVSALNGTVSGAAEILGVWAAGAKFPNRTTGVETGFAGEVAKAAAGMTRVEANEIARKLLPKYEDELKRPPIGVTFPECYHVITVKPKKEWESIYKRIKKETTDLGIPFPRFE